MRLLSPVAENIEGAQKIQPPDLNTFQLQEMETPAFRVHAFAQQIKRRLAKEIVPAFAPARMVGYVKSQLLLSVAGSMRTKPARETGHDVFQHAESRRIPKVIRVQCRQSLIQ